MSFAALERRLNHTFANPALLQQALTHRSHSARHNERLEFLGDGVLNFVVAALLFERFQHIDEGDLSRVRASLVKQSTLADIAQRLDLSGYLRLGEGELKSGGFRRPSILADAVEAILGAIYLDQGFEAVRQVIAGLYRELLDKVDPDTQGKDAKTLLQEWLQGRHLELPQYQVVCIHGVAHDQQFEVECAVPAFDIHIRATGSSRRAAEQTAAGQVLEQLLPLSPVDIKRRQAAGKARQQSERLAQFKATHGRAAQGESR